MRYSELFQRSLDRFPANKPSRSLDLQLLVSAAFNLTKTRFWVEKNEEIKDKNALRRFYRYRKRLEQGEPVAYILKEKEFYGEMFYVDKHVLVPRPETEILVEQAVAFSESPLKVLDIGSGSGVIAVMIAKLTGSAVIAVENCKKALRVLEKNIVRHRVGDNVTPVYADLFPGGQETFDLIVSNPPYIPEQEWRELDPSVRDFEPKAALAAGEDGLYVIRRIVQGARDYLVPGGRLMMEIGYNQKERVEELLRSAGFTSIRFVDDYSSIPRIAVAQHKSTAMRGGVKYNAPTGTQEHPRDEPQQCGGIGCVGALYLTPHNIAYNFFKNRAVDLGRWEPPA
jgi:release factor glutamine methyltransferase